MKVSLMVKYRCGGVLELQYWWELQPYMCLQGIIICNYLRPSCRAGTSLAADVEAVSSDCKQEKGLCSSTHVRSVQVYWSRALMFASHLAYQ